jgi:hypothetical protein
MTKDIVLLFWGHDQKIEKRLKKEFPNAQYSMVENLNPSRAGFMARVQIPYSSLSEVPSKMFYVKRVPHEYWRRQFYWKDYGLARGLVWWDDRVASLNESFPKDLNVWMSGRAEGEMAIKEAGSYVFQAPTASDLIQLTIDGKTIIDFKPKDGQVTAPSGNVKLTAGVHRIVYITYFQHGPNFPNIKILGPSGFNGILGK